MTYFCHLLVTGLLAAVVACAVAVATRPALRPDRQGKRAAACLLVALYGGGAALWAPPGWHILWPALAAAAMLTFVVITRAFGRVDMMAFIIHADFGMKGGTLKGLESEIIAGVVSLSLIVLSVYLFCNLWGFGPWVYWVSAAVLVALNPLVQFGIRRLFVPPVRSDLGGWLVPPGPMTRPDVLPDLILIYLEGTDRRFFDRATFGDVTAPLMALEEEGLSFTNIGQCAGTGWSLAGMVATQSGVPVLPRGFHTMNNLKGVDRFMPALTALGDVLAGHGYAMDYIVGGDPRFAGIDAYYRTHGNVTIIGLAEQSAMHPAEEVEAATIDWILDDQMTFDTARSRLGALTASDAPYLMVIETIGPHGRMGYLSRRASPTGRGIKSRDTDAVLRCTAEEAASFIRDARAAHQAAGRMRPLRIVLMSDHLSHNGATPPVADAFRDRNTVIFLGGSAARNDRAGAMIDVYPTLLHWLGFASGAVAAGLGRSLLAEAPTLVEDRGMAALDAMLTSDAALAAKVWAGS
jgi:phosphoglycerol transferase